MHVPDDEVKELLETFEKASTLPARRGELIRVCLTGPDVRNLAAIIRAYRRPPVPSPIVQRVKAGSYPR